MTGRWVWRRYGLVAGFALTTVAAAGQQPGGAMIGPTSPRGAYYAAVMQQMAGTGTTSVPTAGPTSAAFAAPVLSAPVPGQAFRQLPAAATGGWNDQPRVLSAAPSVARLTAASHRSSTAPAASNFAARSGSPVRLAAHVPPTASPALSFPAGISGGGVASPAANVPYAPATPYGAALILGAHPTAAPSAGAVEPYGSGSYVVPSEPTPAPPAGPTFGYAALPGAVTSPPPSVTPAPGAAVQPTPVPQNVAPQADRLSSGLGTFNELFEPLTGGAPTCDPGTFDPGLFDPAARGCGPWFVSLTGLVMGRNRPNNVPLASLGADPTISILNTEQAGPKWHGGFETRFGRTIGQRWAVEFVYWMLDPTEDRLTVRSEANDINSWLDFDNVSYQGVPLSNVFDNSHEQRLYRYNEFHNIEINLAQQALLVDPVGRYGMGFFNGVRYFRFEEVLNYQGAAAGTEFSDPVDGTHTFYDVHLHNQLTGWQLGGRGHVYLGNRLRLFATPRIGVFGNHISQRQTVCRFVDLKSTKNDVALVGQLDLGVAAQLLDCCSLFIGYRAIGFSGLALADDNIARTLTSLPAMASINSSGSMILHGAQVGLQVQF